MIKWWKYRNCTTTCQSIYCLPESCCFYYSVVSFQTSEDLSCHLIRNYIISNIIPIMFYHKVKPHKNFVHLANNEQNFSHNWMSSNNVNVFLSLFMCIVWKYGMSMKIIIYKFWLRGFLLNLVCYWLTLFSWPITWSHTLMTHFTPSMPLWLVRLLFCKLFYW